MTTATVYRKRATVPIVEDHSKFGTVLTSTGQRVQPERAARFGRRPPKARSYPLIRSRAHRGAELPWLAGE